MFRDPKDAPGVKTVNCLLSDNGMGDHICSLVAVNHIITKFPYINLLVWVPDYLLSFAKHVLPENAIVRNYTEAKIKYKDNRIGISTQRYKHTPMRVHPVDYAFRVLADMDAEMSDKNYLQIRPDEINLVKFKLPEKYVVIGSTFAEKVKAMPEATINEVATFVAASGYTPVFVGKTEVNVGGGDMKMRADPANIKYELGINLIDKTNLLETTAIIAGAKCFVGMDSGINHLAGSTNTKIVVGYTFIKWQHNAPIRNNTVGYNCYFVEPDESLKCAGCQTNMNFVYGHDFRDCYYKDYLCTKQMTSIKFIKELENIL